MRLPAGAELRWHRLGFLVKTQGQDMAVEPSTISSSLSPSLPVLLFTLPSPHSITALECPTSTNLPTYCPTYIDLLSKLDVLLLVLTSLLTVGLLVLTSLLLTCKGIPAEFSTSSHWAIACAEPTVSAAVHFQHSVPSLGWLWPNRISLKQRSLENWDSVTGAIFCHYSKFT